MAADNDPVSQWIDQSGNSRHMVAPTTNGATRPTYKDNATDNLNGFPIVRVASGNGMEIPVSAWPSVHTSAGMTFYWLGKYTPGQTGNGILFYSYEANFAAHQVSLFCDVDVNLFGAGDPAAISVGWESTLDGFSFKYGLSPATSGTQVLAWVFNSAAGTGKIYRNGALLSLTRDNGIYTQSISLGQDFQEFANFAGGTQRVDGDHREFFAFGSAHDAAKVAGHSARLMTLGGI